MFTVRNDLRSWQYRSRGMEPITHPSLVLILRISRATPLLLLCAINGMLWSDLYLLHMWGWLWTVFLYISANVKQQTIKVWNPRNLQRKFASSFPAIGTGKWQKGHNSTSYLKTSPWCFFSRKISKFPVYLFESSTFWYPQCKEWYLVHDKMFFETTALS